METPKRRIKNAIQSSDTKLKFTRIEPDCNNIEDIYTNNLNIYYSYLSDITESKDDSCISITNGILENPDNFVFSKTNNGFEITELDFIKYELGKIKNIAIALSVAEQKQLNFYTDYLNHKKIWLNWETNKQINEASFIFFRSYSHNENERLTNDLIRYKQIFNSQLNELPKEKRTSFIELFSNDLKKLKSKQKDDTHTKQIRDFFKSINTELRTSLIEQSYQIDEYKKAYNSYLFNDILNLKKEDGSINEFYYSTIINGWKNYVFQVQNNIYLEDSKPFLKTYTVRLSYLLSNIVQLFKAINKYDSQNLAVINIYTLKKSEAIILLDELMGTANHIKRVKLSGQMPLALSIKEYCLINFNDAISLLKNSFTIDIYKTPLKDKFQEVKKALETAITIDEAIYLESEFNSLKLNNQKKAPDLDRNWFKIGLLFANGEMDSLLKKYNQNATHIAQYLGNKTGYRPYISESIGVNKQTAQKSIFSNKNKMEAIKNYCIQNNIPVIKSFNDYLPQE